MSLITDTLNKMKKEQGSEENDDKIHFQDLVDGLIGIDYAKNIIKDKNINELDS